MLLFGNPVAIGSTFLQALGWAVINSLWQMALLWVVFQVILSFGVRNSSVKTGLATLLLTAGFGWFLFTLIFHWIIEPSAAMRAMLTIGSMKLGSAAINQQLQTILPFASLAYLLLLSLPAVQFIRNARFVQIIRKRGLSKCKIDLRLFVQRFAQRMGIRKPVKIYISDLISSPVTVGFLKPLILMPLAAISNLSEKQVEAVLLHELAHIRRYDYFLNIIINFIRTILYFNPFVKWFAKTIEREREKSCDEMVMQFQYDPHGYASALLLLEKNNFMRRTMAIAASGQGNDLLHRIEKILGAQVYPQGKRKISDARRWGGLMAGLLCVIGLNALLFLNSPVMEEHSLTFTAFSNPFYHLASGGKEFSIDNPLPQKRHETSTSQTASVAMSTNARPVTRIAPVAKSESNRRFVFVRPATPASGLTLVDALMKEEPVLKKYQEDQVKNTVQATKMVLEQGQWKQVEKSVADALTQAEKQNLKARYYSQLKKVNWKDLEEKLRLSYDQINWDKVNAKLDNAITTLTLDSLTTVYNLALSDLDKAETWMNENKAESIPDTDLKLDNVKHQAEQVRKHLKTLSAIKERKVIHL